jgi:hypothetical protein
MTKYGYASKKSIIDKVKKYYPDTYQDLIKIANDNRKGYNYSLDTIKNDFDAYFLGLLLTDGYISTRGYDVGIDLVDEECISFLSKGVGKEYKTYEPSSGNPNIQAKQKRYRLILTDRALVSELARFGVIQNKSAVIPAPQLLIQEEQFIPYLIRGIIDGDGCIF